MKGTAAIVIILLGIIVLTMLYALVVSGTF